MSTIKALHVSNFQRLREVDIAPGGRQLVVLGGKNAQGKTSVLDAITATLAGTRVMASRPVRDGADKAKTVVELDDGTTITRTITVKEDGSLGGTLRIKLPDGKSPSGGAQGWLNARLGSMTVDPLAFTLMRAQDQATTLREVAGIDTSEVDEQITELRAERTIKGREAKRARGAADKAETFPDAPEVAPEPEVVEASEVLARVEAAEATVRAYNDADRDRAAAESAVHAARAQLEQANAEIQRLRDALARAVSNAAAIESKLESAHTTLNSRIAVKLEAMKSMVDPAPARAELAELEERNREAREAAQAVARQVEANQRAAELEATATALENEYSAMSERIAAAEQARREVVAAADLPVPGLGLDEDGTVTLGGLPFSQASRAEQMRASMAIALAGAPADGIRVALVRDASLLDEDSMQLVADLAQEMGAQVWLERVGSADDGAIVIEDGGVVS